MPIIKQAIKKVRQDKRKTVFNTRVRRTFKDAVAAFRKNPSVKALPGLFSALDRAAKTNVIHKRKASRLKSRLSKLVSASKTSPTKKSSSLKP